MRASLLALCCLGSLLGAGKALAEPTWLVCRVTNNPMFDQLKETAPEAGVKTFAIDAKAKTIKQVSGLFKDDPIAVKEWTEGQIRFEQPGINAPQFAQLQEFRTTVFNRVTGSYAHAPEYRDASGRTVYGDERDQLAASSGRAQTPLAGVKTRVDTGSCEVKQRLL